MATGQMTTLNPTVTNFSAIMVSGDFKVNYDVGAGPSAQVVVDVRRVTAEDILAPSDYRSVLSETLPRGTGPGPGPHTYHHTRGEGKHFTKTWFLARLPPKLGPHGLGTLMGESGRTFRVFLHLPEVGRP